MAFDCYTEEEIGSCTSQVSTTITGNHSTVFRLGRNDFSDDSFLTEGIEMSATSRGPGRPRKNWNDIIHLKSIGVAREDAEHFIFDREVWHERVAQCVFLCLNAQDEVR